MFDGRGPTPRELIDTDPEICEPPGLSRAKVASLRDLAGGWRTASCELDRLREMPDEDGRPS